MKTILNCETPNKISPYPLLFLALSGEQIKKNIRCACGFAQQA